MYAFLTGIIVTIAKSYTTATTLLQHQILVMRVSELVSLKSLTHLKTSYFRHSLSSHQRTCLALHPELLGRAIQTLNNDLDSNIDGIDTCEVTDPVTAKIVNVHVIH